MLLTTGAVRTLITWLTLFFTWSAFVLWQYGGALMLVIMTQSNLYAFDLAQRMAQNGMMPPGVTTVLVVVVVLAAGSLLATGSLICWVFFKALCRSLRFLISACYNHTRIPAVLAYRVK